MSLFGRKCKIEHPNEADILAAISKKAAAAGDSAGPSVFAEANTNGAIEVDWTEGNAIEYEDPWAALCGRDNAQFKKI